MEEREVPASIEDTPEPIEMPLDMLNTVGFPFPIDSSDAVVFTDARGNDLVLQGVPRRVMVGGKVFVTEEQYTSMYSIEGRTGDRADTMYFPEGDNLGAETPPSQAAIMAKTTTEDDIRDAAAEIMDSVRDLGTDLLELAARLQDLLGRE